TLTIIDKEIYGRSEFMPTRHCTSREEIERFYQRQGGYLAILYTLEAADFHSENLVASGEHPILVDLEALFQPRLRRGATEQLTNPTDEIFIHSVLRIGLLPQRIWSSNETAGVDVTGLGGYAGQLTPAPV